jgi:hypothetical protein
MRSLGKGVMSATTKVKVLSPEILHNALGQGFHVPEASIGARDIGERVTGMPGSEAVAGERTVCIGTWEIRDVPDRSCRGAEEATKRYDVPEVGLTHSRGVAGVMPGGASSSLEGVSGLTQRGKVGRAVR